MRLLHLASVIMNHSQLNKYNHSNLTEIKILRSGSYGSVKLFYDQESNQGVVGKLFVATGDQQHIENELANAEREAKFLARLSHENIIKVLGFVHWDDHSVMIIMEYAPCKDLDHLLMNDKDIEIPWKLRARFFTELASALDYLHNHDLKKTYIHGDVKPQNVLLGDRLTIKLTGITIKSGGINNQHAQLYAAPEYLLNPAMEKKCNMDVYSYAMVGYEILTRQAENSEGNASLNVVPQFGLKNCLDDVANNIKNNSGDLAIFNKLKELYRQCWQFDPQHRPNMSDVKKDLYQLARNEKIYDDETDHAVKLLIEKKKLKSEQPPNDQTEKIHDRAGKSFALKKAFKADRHRNYDAMKQWISRLSIAAILLSFVALLLPYFFNNKLVSVPAATGFLVADADRLKKYDIFTKQVTNLSGHLWGIARPDDIKQILKIKNMIYVAFAQTNRGYAAGYTVRINTSDPSLLLREENWKEEYNVKRFIAFKHCIYAVGGSTDGHRTTSFDLHNITTGTWTSLPSMNEARAGHTLVVFDGSICAVGSSENRLAQTLECFNRAPNRWTYLPSMNFARELAAAVELDGELYVMGGFNLHSLRKFTAVEKFNPVTNLWTQVADLNEPRANFAAGVFNGKIYVIGGGSSAVEAYDPSTNVWKVTDNKPEIGLNAKFTVV